MSDLDESIRASIEMVREIGRANIALALERQKAIEESQETQETQAAATGEVEKIGTKLRHWPEEVAAMPTELTRTSLFGLPSDKGVGIPGENEKNKRERKMLRNHKLESRPGIEIYYTGEELSAKDETCWLACLRLGRGIPLGQRIYLNMTDLLNELGLPNTGGKRGNRQAVKNRLERLSAAHFKVEFSRKGKSYSITTGLLKYGIENETGKMYIRLDPDGTPLFENLAYQPWSVRLSLTTDIAARLLSYLSGHEKGKPHQVTLPELKSWCGYGGRPDKFRVAAMNALKEFESKGVLERGASKTIRDGKTEKFRWVRQS